MPKKQKSHLDGKSKSSPAAIGKMANMYNIWIFMNSRIMSINDSKFFAGIVMLMLNIGAKVTSIQFSKSTEEYMKMTVTKQLLVFSMAWMGTRDIYTAVGLTLLFTILSDHLFNDDSTMCIVPTQYRSLTDLIDVNNDNKISDVELSNAITILEKAKRDKTRTDQRNAFKQFDFENYNVIQ